MKVWDIHKLTDQLIAENWTFREGGGDDFARKAFAGALKAMHNRAEAKSDALYVFFEFAADRMNSEYDWDPADFISLFITAYRGSSDRENVLLQQYFTTEKDPKLAPVASDQDLAEYFDWPGYAREHRADLAIRERSGVFYLFEK